MDEIIGKKANKEAVIMSIIRYSENLKSKNIPKSILEVIKKSTITLKTDMMYLNIPKTIINLKILETFYSKIQWDKGEIFFIIQGISEISVVLDSSNYTKLKKKLNADEIELQYPQTALLIIHSPPEAAGYGVLNYLTKPIADAGISIEVLTMTRDTIILVDEKNSAKLFQVLKDMIDNSRFLYSQ